MHCKMDVDDPFLRDPDAYRRRGCRCGVSPIPPEVGFGCRCPRCGKLCRRCPGFGYVLPPVRQTHQILSSIRSFIRRRVRTRGCPPGFVRLRVEEVDALLRKLAEERKGHWIRDCVEPGPPARVFDVLVVEDLRRVRGVSTGT